MAITARNGGKPPGATSTSSTATVHRLVGPIAVALTGSPALRASLGAMLPRAPEHAERGAASGASSAQTVIPLHATHGAPAAGRDPVVTHELAAISRDPEGGVLVWADGVSATVDAEGVSLRVRRDVAPELLRLVLDMTWPVVLARLGFFHLHAAVVRDPRGRGWLLAGEANVGKSTSTVGLTRAGWEYTADDAVYITVRDDGVVAHGWEEPVRLSARAAAALGVARSDAAAGEKAPAIVSAELAARRTDAIRIDRLVFPQFGSATTHAPLSPTAALASLVRAAPCIIVEPAIAPRYLAALGRTASLPAASLVLGGELLRDPDCLAEYLTAVAHD